RPFSRGQLKQILRQAKLTPIKWADALLFPPFRREGLLKFGGFIENISKRISPMFGGVIVVEATKRLYQGLPVTKTKQRRAFVPVLAPQAGSSRTSKKSKQS
ncbi:MAG: SAM-dependent methyltransferase, partial [Nitratireductor sp.]